MMEGIKKTALLLAVLFIGSVLAGCSHDLVFDFRYMDVTSIEATDCTTDVTIVLDQDETNYVLSDLQKLKFVQEDDYGNISNMFIEGNAIYELVFYSDEKVLEERLIILWDNLIVYGEHYYESEEALDLLYLQGLFETVD